MKTLKFYQEQAVASAVALFSYTKSLLVACGGDEDQRATILRKHGHLLIEAPTGAGKTLMAGMIVERFSQEDGVVWFWFAPFKSVVEQTSSAMREDFAGIRYRNLQNERHVGDVHVGDVFVTTWASVATRLKDLRSIRRDGESSDSIDSLVVKLRRAGFRIGVVVDEAHHGFRREAQAAKFFHDVLRPDYSILITATPDDAQIEDFQRKLEIDELARISVSRVDCVDAGLVKYGVQCVAYLVSGDDSVFVNSGDLALRHAVAHHQKVKRALVAEGVDLVPLMLVQASTNEEIKRIREKLMELGFEEDQIMTHTADEPDANLLGVEQDHRYEVLIFKMAVALGFDAPRAFTLYSTRAVNDQDFGVQLVGRILRVHRRLQGRSQQRSLPECLNYGWVFLANADTQGGIDKAGQAINAIQTEYAKISPTHMVIVQGEEVFVQDVDPATGQISCIPVITPHVPLVELGVEEKVVPIDWVNPEPEFLLEGELDLNGICVTSPSPIYTPPRLPEVSVVRKKCIYELKDSMPRSFQRQEMSKEIGITVENCAEMFRVSAKEMIRLIREKFEITVKTIDVFEKNRFDQSEMYFETIDAERAALLAMKELRSFDLLNPKVLKRCLLEKIRVCMVEFEIDGADDELTVEALLNLILARSPHLLRNAVKEAQARNTRVICAEPLPVRIESESRLQRSRLNIYGVIPSGLNNWEVEFVEKLESDPHGHVLWWHRNEPKKPYSISVVLPDGGSFFPDFIVGVSDRRAEDHGLLVDPKFQFEITKEVPKSYVEHPSYGRVMILTRSATQFFTVRYDDVREKPVVDEPFATNLMRDFGL